MWESSDGWLLAWAFHECVLIRSSTLWLHPFTCVVTTPWRTLVLSAALTWRIIPLWPGRGTAWLAAPIVALVPFIPFIALVASPPCISMSVLVPCAATQTAVLCMRGSGCKNAHDLRRFESANMLQSGWCPKELRARMDQDAGVNCAPHHGMCHFCTFDFSDMHVWKKRLGLMSESTVSPQYICKIASPGIQNHVGNKDRTYKPAGKA